MIKIEDNLIEKVFLDNLKEKINSQQFPWFYCDRVVYPGDGDFQFCHTFYENFEVQSEFINLLEPILNKMEIHAIRRIKANMTLKKDNIRNYLMHTDYDDGFEGLKTSVFYLDSSNGKTVFETGEEVESKGNRLVTFPAKMKHTGTTHTDIQKRIVININYY